MTKSAITVTKTKQAIRLQATGNLHVQQAKHLKARLLEILAEPMETVIALDAVTSMDTTAVQMIYQFKQEMKHPVKVSYPHDAKVLALLEKTGITKLL